jgi:hypothetical protein
MYTVVETNTFHSKASRLWSRSQHEDFVLFIAQNPFAGEIISGTGGVRKVRWGKQSAGKRGGVRVIYFVAHESEIWLLSLYAKSERSNIPASELRKIKGVISGEKNE